MRLQDLFERISEKVFHYTGILSALSILQQDKFNLTTAFGTGSEKDIQAKDKLYYLSLTRTLTGKYHETPGPHAVMLNIDGRELSQNYSGKPVDYWGREFREIDPRSESEDRVFSDKPHIPNASRYITSIHILLAEPEKLSDKVHQATRNLMILGKSKDIPVHVYNDPSGWRLQDPKKRVRFKDKPIGKDDSPRFGTMRRRRFSAYGELLHGKNQENLSKTAKRLLDKIKYYRGEFSRELSNDIHNFKAKAEETGLSNFLAQLKKLNLRSTEEVEEYIRNRWD